MSIALGEILMSTTCYPCAMHTSKSEKNVILKTLVANVTSTSDNFCSTKTEV
jgi:hypothetical protein